MEGFTLRMQKQTHVKDMAIIGIAAKLPEAENYTEFWNNLLQGRASVRKLPSSRKGLSPFFDMTKEYALYGYLEGIDLFDTVFFKTLPEVARNMDPAHRLLLETVNDAIADAGYYREQLTGESVGVFLTDLNPEYYRYLSENGLDILAGNLPANLAGRIAYFNGFTGPALSIDTACSSGLVALHTAIQNVVNGDCQMAIVGGANIKIELPLQTNSDLGVMSPTGQCRSFSADADGTAGGEGVIAIIIKPLKQALNDRDHIYAVIKGSAVNQDGSSSNGLTAPSPLAQKDVIQAAWRSAGVDPTTISYIETHGSATKLGDPIEITGITDAFREFTNDYTDFEKQFCPIGAVKTNIGHLGNLAGLAGLLKTILALKYQKIPPTINFSRSNPFIDFKNSPVYLNTSLENWTIAGDIPRRAGVSSFGLSGTNCHVILEEAPKKSADMFSPYQLFTLSGENKKQLERRIDDLLTFFQNKRIDNFEKLQITDVSYTLNCGRKHYPDWRCAFVAGDWDELVNQLYTSCLYEKSRQVNKIEPVFLLPDYEEKYTAYYSDYLRAQLPGQKWIAECRKISDLQNPRIAYFTFLYTQAKIWTELGLKAKSVIGLGVGEKVSAVLSNRLSLEEALQQTITDKDNPINLEKLRIFIQAQISKGRNLFLHFTEESQLGEEVQRCITSNTGIEFYTGYAPDQGKTWSTTLGQMYINGHNLNWEAIQQGQRTALPAHPYDKKSYWFNLNSGQREFRKQYELYLDLEAQTNIRFKSDELAMENSADETRTNYLSDPSGILDSFELSSNPQTEEIVELLLTIWKSRLGLAIITPDDDFIELGGDSIRAMLLINDIKKYCGVTLELSYLLQYGTINALAVKIIENLNDLAKNSSSIIADQQIAAASHSEQFIPSATPITKAAGISYYQLSPSQKNLWIVHQMEKEEIVYNEPMALVLEGKLNLNALNQALQAMIKRHASFRTFFTLLEGKPVQGVYDHLTVNIEVEELNNYDQALMTNLVDREAGEPFDLEQAPLFRAKLFRLAEDKYLFSFVVHHIIFDGWSVLIFVRDICNLYEAYVQNLSDPLMELAIQYYDYAHWQNQQLTSSQLAKSEKYWLHKLDDELPILNLPTDYPRPVEKSFAGSSLSFEIPEELSVQIKDLSRRSGSTLFIIMLTFFEILLHKYSRQQEFIIGTPSDNRSHDQLWGLIGFFVNTFAIRQCVDKNDSFLNLLSKVKANLLESYQHKDYPFTELVSRLKAKRDPGRGVLFDVMYVFHNVGSIESTAEQKKNSYGGINFRQFSRKEIVSDYDLKLEFAEGINQFAGKIEYSTHLFKEATIERMTKHLIQLIQKVVRDPDKKVSELSLMTSEEWNWLNNEINATDSFINSEEVISNLLNVQMRKTPDAAAIYLEDRSITYRELDQRSNQIAHFLRSKGVGSDTIVGVMIERSVDMFYGIFGILKAGGAYLPIAPTFPSERIAYILQDSQAKLVLVNSQSAGQVPPRFTQSVEEINLSVESNFNFYSTVQPKNLNKSSDLIYVIYTSGSTGEPKGVMIEHLSLLNRLQWMQKTYSLNSKDVILHKTTFTFDISVWEILLWALYGSSVYLLSPGGEKDPILLVEAIEKGKVTIIHFVPSMLNAFLEYLDSHPEQIARLVSLRQVFSSGEALFWSTVAKFDELLGRPLRITLDNLYGPTEASIDVSYFQCTGSSGTGIVSVGKPIDNIKLFILDENLAPNPVGIPGEIGISGLGLARGYLNKLELTEDKFVSVDFLHGERIYLSGDLGRLMDDGNIEFRGRLDHQVKIRGYRIEPGEIESVLCDHLQIKEGVVLAKGDPESKYLAAYVVGEPSLTTRMIKEHLLKFLPEYMVPGVVLFLDEMPRLTNGKIDRKSLLTTELNPLPTEPLTMPQNQLETDLTIIWSNILGVKQVGIQTNFFDLGGDSIKAIQIASEISKLGIDIRMNDIMQQQTINNLCSYLLSSGKMSKRSASQPSGKQTELVEGEVTLTPIQRWFFTCDLEKPEHWNQSVLLDLHSLIDSRVLTEALTQLIKHHDSLRLIYHSKTACLFYHNLSLQRDFELREYNLSGYDEDEQNQQMSILGEELKSSIDLESGLLIKGAIFELGVRGRRLLITIHHLICDIVSLRILLRDLHELCDKLLTGEKPVLSPKTMSYKDWANLLYEYCESEQLVTEIPFWNEQLDIDYALPERCFDKEDIRGDHQPESPILNNSTQRYRLNQVSGQLTEEETTQLITQVHTAYNTNLTDLLLTALALTLTNWIGKNQHLIVLESHGREEISSKTNLIGTVGWFTSLYPVKLDLGQKNQLADQIKTIKEQLRQIPRGGIGYGILKYLKLVWKEDKEFPIMFNYIGEFALNQPDNNSDKLFTLSSENTGLDISSANKPIFKLEVSGLIFRNRFQINFGYRSDLYDRVTIETLCTSYLSHLRLIIQLCSGENAGYTPSDFEMADLDQDELDQLSADLEHLMEGLE